MRYLLACVFLLLSACSAYPPTGDVVAPPTHWKDGTQVLMTVDIRESLIGDPAVLLTVEGDIVYDIVKIDDIEYTLSGTSVDEDWLNQQGNILIHLSPGTHNVQGYSCMESFTGWKCGCRSENDCGHWMQRSVTIS